MTAQEINRVAVRRYRAKNREKINAKRREYYWKNVEKSAAYAKIYRANPEKKAILAACEQRRRNKPGYAEKHREEVKLYNREHKDECKARYDRWRKSNVEHVRDYTASRYKEKMKDPVYREEYRRKQKAYQLSVKLSVFKHYGEVCACCREGSIEFLCIDHINGNGNAHRREIKNDGGSAFYLWLRRNSFPDGYQVLCHNCNMAKSCYGSCPHKKEMVI